MSSMTLFGEHFAAKAAKVNPSAPSTTKWRGVRDLFAEENGLDPEDVYVATISKPGNVSVRFGQSAAAHAASVLIGMHTDKPATVDKTIEAMRAVAAPRDSVAVIATPHSGEWTVVAILARSSDTTAASISRSFPDVVVLPL